MAFSKDSTITQADISALITKINAESTRRGSSYTVATVSVGDQATSTTAAGIEWLRRTLNAIHSKTRTGKAAGTPGAALSLTDYSANLAVGQLDTVSYINQINTDTTSLTNQCDCNAYGVTNCCNLQCNNCANGTVTCNNGTVTCNNGLCANGTCCKGQNCYSQASCCNNNCCQSNGCCNSNAACCNSNAAACGANGGYCSANVCTCNSNCACEFN